MRFPKTPLAEQEADAAATTQDARNIFVASLRDFLARYSVPMLLHDAAVAYAGVLDKDEYDVPQRHMRAFADGYGWPSTFRAIAQAIEADDVAKREAERRR
jgi:hypothetical protein